MSGFAWRTLCQNASTVWPERVRPEASTIVPLMISGTRSPSSSNSDSTAKIAAFAFNVSKIVSTSRRSAPPSTRPAAASRYAVSSSSQLTPRAAGSLTSGLIDAVRLVGPSDPATYRGRPGSARSAASAASRARRAAATFISRTSSGPKP